MKKLPYVATTILFLLAGCASDQVNNYPTSIKAITPDNAQGNYMPRSLSRGMMKNKEIKPPKLMDIQQTPSSQLFENILFDNNSDIIHVSQMPKLASNASMLLADETLMVRLIGGASVSGSDKLNKRLGQRRADNIKEYLIGEGVNPNRIIATTRGMITDHDVTTADKRRVEFQLIQLKVQ